MTGFPDDNPPTVMPFPADPASYIRGASQFVQLGGGSSSIVILNNGGHLTLVQDFQVHGYVWNQDAATPRDWYITLNITNGLNNEGNNVVVAGVGGTTGYTAAGVAPATQWFEARAPTPFVVRQASAGVAQAAGYVTNDGGTGKIRFKGYITFLAWALD